MTALTIIMALASLGYGVWCAIDGTVRVGSKSYHGGVRRYTREDNPLQFWFWCAFFIGLGSLCAVGALLVDK
jgi:hypothetical protein